MNIIVLQHIKIEDPGYIKDLMLADGVKLTTIELDEGEKIPNNLNQFDGMFCMGGPMDTYMEKDYPWLIEEKKAINNTKGTIETKIESNINKVAKKQGVKVNDIEDYFDNELIK
jgi:GMP synthase-like glutamine amidotransferase